MKVLTAIRRGNASTSVKKIFYTHAIRSLIDFCGPYLLMASPKSLQTLDVVQNQSFRLIFSAPKWSKICNLCEETNLPSVLHRIQQLTTGLLARMTLSDR